MCDQAILQIFGTLQGSFLPNDLYITIPEILNLVQNSIEVYHIVCLTVRQGHNQEAFPHKGTGNQYGKNTKVLKRNELNLCCLCSYTI